MIKLKTLMREADNDSNLDKSTISTNIIIGDSQTGLVSRNSTKVQLIDELQEGGKGVGWLRDQVAAYPVSPNVKNVVLCIGTNGGYSSKGSAEIGLFRKFIDIPGTLFCFTHQQ